MVYSQKPLDHTQQYASEALKCASKSVIQKTLLIELLIEFQKAQKFDQRTV